VCNYDDVSTLELASMLAYNATVLAAASPRQLETVRPDLLEAAELLIPAAEHIEEQPGGARGPAINAGETVFLAIPRPSV
jgi:hypothetical protein